jgi:hypothetical protein
LTQMAKHYSEIEIERYRRRKSAPQEMLDMSDHLHSCEECFKKLKIDPEEAAARLYYAIFNPIQIAEDIAATEHLLYEQIEGYVDGYLSQVDREGVEIHAEVCAECREDLRDILALKAAMETEALSAEAPPSTPVAIPVLNETPSLLVRLRAAFGVGKYRLTFALTGLTLVLLLVAVAVITRLRHGVADLQGKVAALQQENTGLRQLTDDPVRLKARLAQLQPSQVPPSDGSSASEEPTSLKDAGGVVSLTKDGTVGGLPGLPSEYIGLVTEALRAGKIERAPAIALSIGRIGAVRGQPPQNQISFRLLSPVGTAVEETRPKFKWEPVKGGASYVVSLKDLQSGLEVDSGPITATQWSPDQDLARGHTFAWTVEASVGGETLRAPAPDKPYAGFRVIGGSQEAELAKARKNWSNSHLVLGLLYARSGLQEQARKELQELQADNPDSKVAKDLLESRERSQRRPGATHRS